jgi:hypothetical protein
MLKAALFLLAVTVAFAADDPWDKVRKLKSGTEVRIVKQGAPQPVLGKFDEATEESLIVVVKNEQVAIPRDKIDRIDYRPPGGSRVTKETKTTQEAPGEKPAPPGVPQNPSGSSSSSSVTIGSKPDFETIYRRSAGPAGK